jgi:hypothetical protein
MSPDGGGRITSWGGSAGSGLVNNCPVGARRPASPGRRSGATKFSRAGDEATDDDLSDRDRSPRRDVWRDRGDPPSPDHGREGIVSRADVGEVGRTGGRADPDRPRCDRLGGAPSPRYEMPRDEISAVLGADNPELVRRHMELHRERLEERLAEQLRALAGLERLLVQAIFASLGSTADTRVAIRERDGEHDAGHP